MTILGTPVMTLVAGYLATLIVFGVIDFVWLAVVARSYYRGAIGHLLAERFNAPAALAFYLIYVLGLVVFAVAPALTPEATWVRALAGGAALGFFCYATYDLTNLATLKQWPLALALVDMAWGAALSGVSALAGWSVARYVAAM